MFVARINEKWQVWDFCDIINRYFPASIEFTTQQEAVKCMEKIKRITGIL